MATHDLLNRTHARMHVLAQVLRLPPEQGTSLLTHNRQLLALNTELPERMEALRSLLGITGAPLAYIACSTPRPMLA